MKSLQTHEQVGRAAFAQPGRLLGPVGRSAATSRKKAAGERALPPLAAA
jgi:hypothetical protein